MIEEIVADKGYHGAQTLELAEDLNFRTYIPEPKRPHRARWTDKPAEFQQAVYVNRRRLKRGKSRKPKRLCSERVERTFARVCDTGGMRRSWLKGILDVGKRYLIAAAAAHNLGRIMRKLFGIGKPRSLQGLGALAALVQLLKTPLRAVLSLSRLSSPARHPKFRRAAA